MSSPTTFTRSSPNPSPSVCQLTHHRTHLMRAMPEDKMIALIQHKAPYGSKNHGSKCIHGRKINEWYALEQTIHHVLYSHTTYKHTHMHTSHPKPEITDQKNHVPCITFHISRTTFLVPRTTFHVPRTTFHTYRVLPSTYHLLVPRSTYHIASRTPSRHHAIRSHHITLQHITSHRDQL